MPSILLSDLIIELISNCTNLMNDVGALLYGQQFSSVFKVNGSTVKAFLEKIMHISILSRNLGHHKVIVASYI